MMRRKYEFLAEYHNEMATRHSPWKRDDRIVLQVRRRRRTEITEPPTEC
jgi:hypothetical protein